jgi:hypothetical protein
MTQRKCPNRAQRRVVSGRGLSFLLCALSGCVSGPQQATGQVEVAPFESQQIESSYVLLEEQIFRFANRFGTRIALASDRVIESVDDPEDALRILRWKSIANSTMINLAVGPDAVGNLLDTIVVTTLSRLVLEDYWVPEVLGSDIGGELLEAYRVLEADIWSIADRVLTEQQQSELLSLIEEWHAGNPDQIYPWNVRLDEFSGQRAANILRVRQSGGLLGIRGAAQSIDAIASLTERVMFYLEYLPRVLQNSVQETYFAFLLAPNVDQSFNDLNRFVDASQDLVAVVERLPETRFEVVSQVMEDIGRERAALFDEVGGLSPDAQAVFADLRQSLEALERILILAGASREKAPDERQFDIRNFSEFAAEAATAARDMEGVVAGLEQLLASPAWVERGTQVAEAADRVESLGTTLIDRLALGLGLVVVLFFVCLLVYQMLSARITPRHRRSPQAGQG